MVLVICPRKIHIQCMLYLLKVIQQLALWDVCNISVYYMYMNSVSYYSILLKQITKLSGLYCDD